MAEYWGLSPRRFLRALTEGRFGELMGGAADRWHSYCAAIAEDGLDRAILRLYAGEEDGGPYFVWVAYRIVGADPVALRIESIALPSEEPQGRLAMPEDLEGEPFFAYPPGEPRGP